MQTSPWNALNFTQAQCEADLNHQSITVHIAVNEEDKIVGFLASMKHGIGFEPMIEYLCIDESYRSKGIGTALIRYFETELFPDADNLYLFV